MKRLFPFIFCLAALTLQAAHVQFDMTDFVTGGIARRTMYVKPTGVPKTNITDIVTGDALRRFTDTAGQCIISNMVHGVYSCMIFGPETNTIFSILVPDSTNLLNAADLLTSVVGISDIAGYTISQANARFVLRNSGVASNLIVTNIALYGNISGVSLDDLNDVVEGGAQQYQVITRVGPAWVNSFATMQGSLSDVSLPLSITAGHVLKYIGGAWTNAVDEIGTNSPSSNLILTNSIWLAMNGNDSTGTRGDMSKPYLTLSNAVSALQNGDSMLIYPGDYPVTLDSQRTNFSLLLDKKTNITIIGLGQPRIRGTNTPYGHMWTLRNCENI